jgi:hypothetical protein
VADRDEHPGDVELALLTGLGVAQGDRLELVGAVDGGDLVPPVPPIETYAQEIR